MSRHEQITRILHKLQRRCIPLLHDLLLLDRALSVLFADLVEAFLQRIEGVQVRSDAEHEACKPRFVRVVLEGLVRFQGANAGRVDLFSASIPFFLQQVLLMMWNSYTYHSDVVQEQIPNIAQLAPNSHVPQDRVAIGIVICHCCSLKMLYPFCQPQELARGPEVLLNVLEPCYIGLRMVRAEEIPRVEAREVLDCAEQLVTSL